MGKIERVEIVLWTEAVSELVQRISEMGPSWALEVLLPDRSVIVVDVKLHVFEMWDRAYKVVHMRCNNGLELFRSLDETISYRLLLGSSERNQ